jgi:UDP:flavonoid glycosyltransferase YjiC (YdhE family)
LERLLSDDALRDNMVRLKALQDQVDGPANAARKIVHFLGATT